MVNYSKYIGYALFIATLIGWGFTAGKFDSRIQNLETTITTINTKVDKQQDLLLEEQKFNSKVSVYIEILQNKKSKVIDKTLFDGSLKTMKLKNVKLDSIINKMQK